MQRVSCRSSERLTIRTSPPSILQMVRDQYGVIEGTLNAPDGNLEDLNSDIPEADVLDCVSDG